MMIIIIVTVTIIIIGLVFLTRYSIPMEWKNYAMQYKKVQKIKLQ